MPMYSGTGPMQSEAYLQISIWPCKGLRFLVGVLGGNTKSRGRVENWGRWETSGPAGGHSISG